MHPQNAPAQAMHAFVMLAHDVHAHAMHAHTLHAHAVHAHIVHSHSVHFHVVNTPEYVHAMHNRTVHAYTVGVTLKKKKNAELNDKSYLYFEKINGVKGTHARDFHSLFLNLFLHLSITNRYKTQYNQHFRKSSSNSPRFSKFSITPRFRQKREA
jgi:hypothetical protein